jgi:hypothetical protein
MSNQKKFIWNNTLYEKFYIIRNVDIHAGFCALVLYALNGIRKAESHHAIPVIHFDKKNTPNFYDHQFGESIWDYFFEAVSPYTIHDVQLYNKKKILASTNIYLPSPEEVMWCHHQDKDRLATFWSEDTPINKENWMKEKRKLGQIYIKKYINTKSNITKKVDLFVNNFFKNFFVIGVHIRGTDFAYATSISITHYFEEIDKIIHQNNSKIYRIFIATDQEQYLAKFKSRYKEQLTYINAIRSYNHIAPFRMEQSDAYKKGEDVLLDILILSKCNHIIKGAAAVGEMALWFNSNITTSDFSLQSEFVQKPYHKLETAYSLLNIGQKKPWALAIHKLKFKIIRRMQDTTIGFELSKKFKFIRKLLRH